MSSLEQNGNDYSDTRRKNPSVPVCRTLNDFEIIDQLGEGTFGLVFKAREKATGQVLALKKVRMEKETQGFPLTALREIKILKYIKDKNIVNLLDVITGNNNDDVYLVFEFVDHDLSGLFNLKPDIILKPEIIKSYMKQLLEGLNYLHVNKIIHRDIKTSNLLVSNEGILKLADFGLSRPIITSEEVKYTPNMITLWYRPPELLLGDYIRYSTEVDLWSVGCILAELLCKKALFPGYTEVEQLDLILKLCGLPDEETIEAVPSFKKIRPKVEYKSRLKEELSKVIKDSYAVDLIEKLLSLNPNKRISTHEALDHDYFWNEPLPCPPEEIPPLGESCHEYTSKKRSEKMKQMRMSKNPNHRDYIKKPPYHSQHPSHNPHHRFQNYNMNPRQYPHSGGGTHQYNNPNRSHPSSHTQQSNNMPSNYQKYQPKKTNYQSYFR